MRCRSGRNHVAVPGNGQGLRTGEVRPGRGCGLRLPTANQTRPDRLRQPENGCGAKGDRNGGVESADIIEKSFHGQRAIGGKSSDSTFVE